MDELKLKLSTKFMRGFVAGLISKAIYKKIGYHVDIDLSEIEISNENGKVHIHVNVDAEVNSEDFKKIIKTIGQD